MLQFPKFGTVTFITVLQTH